MQAAGGEASPGGSVIESEDEAKVEDAKKKAEEEEQAKKLEQAKKEEEDKKAEEEKKRAEEEAKKKAAEEEKKRAEEEAKKKAAEEEKKKSSDGEDEADVSEEDITKRKAVLNAAASSLSFSKTSPQPVRSAQSSPPTVRASQIVSEGAGERATSRSEKLKANRRDKSTPEPTRKEESARSESMSSLRADASSAKGLSARVRPKKARCVWFLKNFKGAAGSQKEPSCWKNDRVKWRR
jgi:hypothetical protein